MHVRLSCLIWGPVRQESLAYFHAAVIDTNEKNVCDNALSRSTRWMGGVAESPPDLSLPKLFVRGPYGDGGDFPSNSQSTRKPICSMPWTGAPARAALRQKAASLPQ
jgi:hypothetical protein